jgi:hypothetical protein
MYDNEIFTMEEIVSVKVFNEVFVYHLQGILNAKGRAFFEKKFTRLKADLV